MGARPSLTEFSPSRHSDLKLKLNMYQTVSKSADAR